MKVLVVIPSFYPAVIYGGTIFSSLNTSKELAKKHKVRVSTTNTNMYSKLDVPTNIWLEMDGFQVKYYNELKVDKFSLQLTLNLWKDIRWADVVHIQAIFNTPTPIALLYAWLFRKPVLLSPRGVLGDWVMNQGNSFKKKWLQLFIKPFANRIHWHATAEQEKKEILHHFPKAKVSIISNGIDLSNFEGQAWLSRGEYLQKYTGKVGLEDTKVVVSLGRIHAKKGFDILIQSMISLPDNVLLIIGGHDEGELQKLKTLVGQLKLEERVFFCGEIDVQSKKEFLMHADVFALTSHNENFGNVYAEALACGIPIVASVFTPWKEVERNHCGSWIELDPGKSAAAISYWLKQEKNQNAVYCRRYVAKFGWAGVADAFNDIFKQLKK
ncbi:MAG: glycosyltransferase [Cytophaga sp.]|uniref:glycosyltransferase n=1 Tax=Cytophaga sp. TaxID=29535 RepID=UPI003F81DBD1